MSKEKHAFQLFMAKGDHKRCLAQAEALVEGLSITDIIKPVLPTDCDFGQWYYADGRKLSRLPSYAKLDVPHEKMHSAYMKLFTLFSKQADEAGSFFGKGKREKQFTAEANEHLSGIRHAFDEMNSVIEALEFEIEQACKQLILKKKEASRTKKKMEVDTLERELDQCTGELESLEVGIGKRMKGRG